MNFFLCSRAMISRLVVKKQSMIIVSWRKYVLTAMRNYHGLRLFLNTVMSVVRLVFVLLIKVSVLTFCVIF